MAFRSSHENIIQIRICKIELARTGYRPVHIDKVKSYRILRHEYRKLCACIDEDINVAIEQASDLMVRKQGSLRRVSVFLTPPLLCVFLYRLAHLLWNVNARRLARFLAWVNFVMHKASISPASKIGAGLYIPHTVGIMFHGIAGAHLILFARAVVAANSINFDISNHPEAYPVLGDGVQVGAWGRVIGSLKIGSHTKIAPYTVVTQDVMPNSIVFRRR